jgi:glutamate/tyrosine decarboxylase-like PLP-dependent enzyme
MEQLLHDAATRAARYLSGVPNRPVGPRPEDIAGLAALGGPLPQDPTDPAEVLALLDQAASPATVATTGGRYFGFVTGGALPATVAANILATAWDQNGALRAMSPAAAAVEEAATAWILDVLQLPPESVVGFVTGATMANFTCLAAARHALLQNAGWNVEEDGLFGAPPIHVIVGQEVHVALLKALAMLGFGRKRVTRVPVDNQGRIIAAQLPALDNRTLVCLQAGNVNTGAFDPAPEICAKAREAGAWVHTDGAFGLWAAAAPSLARLMEGYSLGDSWATDNHKWLNVPYDSGLAIVREPRHLHAAMSVAAAYLQLSVHREPSHYTPEASRRARGVEVWAALRSLGRRGLAGMIESNCRMAQRMASHLRDGGFQILNEVVLNQVMVSFGDPETTRRIVAAIQADGTCWCGATQWQGQTAMRISVSNWSTTEDDIDASATAILRLAHS